MNIELKESEKIRLANSQMVFEIMRKVLLREEKLDRDCEHCYIVCLDASNKLLNIELVSMGSHTETTLKPMQVFRIAIYKNAVKVIMVHTHPASDLQPSNGDKSVTDQMIQVGNIIEIKVVDHLIMSDENYFSFEKSGLMEQLIRQSSYKPTFLEIERIKKEARKIGEKAGLEKGKKLGLEKGIEKGIKKGKQDTFKEVALSMKNKGIDVDAISEITGLSKNQIKKL